MTGPVNPNRLAVGAVAAVLVLLGGAVGCSSGPCSSILSISTESRLPTGAVGHAYFFPLEVGTECAGTISGPRAKWRLESGDLPLGLKLSIDGDIDGEAFHRRPGHPTARPLSLAA